VMSLEIFRRLKEEGYSGGKSALYALVSALRPKPVEPVVRFEGLAGEFSQHDFGQVDVRFMDGHSRRIHFFASRLKYSRWVEVTIVPDERAETLVRALVAHFESMGGVPLLAVFDRPKTIAVSWRRDGVVTAWNATFAQVALELRVGVELCWPYRPNQKGAVENLVKWVKGSFFKQRRFVDEEDLERQLADWHVEVNTTRPSRATGIIPAERMKEERPRLRPLHVTSETLFLRTPVQVGATGMVLHDTHSYSMPPEAIGLPGTLYLGRDRVRIVAGKFEAEHARLFEKGAKSILPEHRDAQLETVRSRRGRSYYKRQQLLELGGPVQDYLTELLHRRPRRAVREFDQIYGMLAVHGGDLVRAAIAQAHEQEVFGVEYVATALGELRRLSSPAVEVAP
jgi:transposase